MIAPLQVLLSYVGVALAWRALQRADRARRDAALRSAWFGAFAVVACSWLGSTRADRLLDALPLAFALAGWITVLALDEPRAWLGVLALMLEALVRGRVLDACAILSTAVLAALLARVIVARRALPVRTLAYWVTFVGTFAWIIPSAIAARTAGSTLMDGHALAVTAVVLSALGLALALVSTAAFYRAGGTPEPSDPPRTLVTSGIYAYVRHPIQWAQLLLVWSAFVARPLLWVGVYALCFTIALVGPARFFEEQRLQARFGDSYRVWRADVPRWRRDTSASKG